MRMSQPKPGDMLKFICTYFTHYVVYIGCLKEALGYSSDRKKFQRMLTKKGNICDERCSRKGYCPWIIEKVNPGVEGKRLYSVSNSGSIAYKGMDNIILRKMEPGEEYTIQSPTCSSDVIITRAFKGLEGRLKEFGESVISVRLSENDFIE